MSLLARAPLVFAIGLLGACSGDADHAPEQQSLRWGASGVCGDVFFWTASEDGTSAVTVTAAYNRILDQPMSLAFSLPDSPVDVDLVEGHGLDRYFCTDLRSGDAEAISTKQAASGSGEIHLDAVRGSCSDVRGQLSLRDVTGPDGRIYPPVDIDEAGVGCVSG